MSPDATDDERNNVSPTAESAEQAPESEVPDDEELDEPSTENEPGEEPRAPKPDDSEPDHEAIGIGVIDGPSEP
ncbi:MULTISPECIES: hypothetical protein [unclassified Leifsonia]|uniref:hypothetical protein n=1 Tax=unclassified Leifsonia TaxID=2663824 RepID=UPI000A8923FC|nr:MULTISPECIES: hypothetical protein [unclassified Leifsonia]